MKVKSESEVADSDRRDCSLSGFSAHGIFQARGLEWVAIAFSTAYLWLYDIVGYLPEILIPACVSSSPAFLMMYSA